MTADDGDTQGANWPLPKFFFSVNLGDPGEVSFQEVAGLDIEAQQIEYREGNIASPIQMPGLQATGIVTLKRGIFTADNNFWDWHNQVKMNVIKRQSVVISLLDDMGKPTMVWTLKDAWPSKIGAPAMRGGGGEVALEMIELTHEGLTVESP